MRRFLAFILSFALVAAFFTGGVRAEQDSNGETAVINTVGDDGVFRLGVAALSAISDGASAKIQNGKIVWDNAKGFITFRFEVAAEGDYTPIFRYRALEGTTGDIEIGMQLDGRYPSVEFESFFLKRLWKNANDEISKDSEGNEYSPEQTEEYAPQSSGVWDSSGFTTNPMTVHLTVGAHTLTLFARAEPFELDYISFTKPYQALSYADTLKLYQEKGYRCYEGEEIVIEGESADYKSIKTAAPLSTRADPSVSPSDARISKLNYIGGNNWSKSGDTLYWNIEVGESALYKIGFRFHQTYVQEGASFRALTVDGVSPFREAETISFDYRNGWQTGGITDENGDMLVYLPKGKHTLALRVTMGDLSDVAQKMQTTVSEIGAVYRQIVTITGETPDNNRDYNLFTAIPDLQENLEGIRASLKSYISEIETIYGMKGGSASQVMEKTIQTIDAMLRKKYKAQSRKNSLYDNYASLSSWLYEMQSMPLDIDCIMLTAPDKDYERKGTGFFKKIAYSAERLLSSFAGDYQIADDSESLVIWTSWGRDQVNALSSLIDGDFTRKTGIRVNFKITNASLIQARLSGRAPDIQIGLGRSMPVDYGMRGVLYDLTQFVDCDEVLERFQRNAAVPYRYNGALYGLPETQSFPMMFVRTDILEELGLSIPRTWDELLLTAKILAMNHMQVGLSEQQTGADLTTVLSMFAVQNKLSFYREDHSASTFSTAAMQQLVTRWTSFYTQYNFPVTYSFYNRFKIGLIPIAIRDYSQYATISAAAPEIHGKWKMVTVPGTIEEDGSINNSVCGSGTAVGILSSTNKLEEAWTFLKWWTSADIQFRYASAVESILGVSARVATANNEARLRLGYDAETTEMLKAQLEQVEEMPVIPGSYYTERIVLQLFCNIVNNGQNVKQMLDKWSKELDGEITRKTEEYAKLR